MEAPLVYVIGISVLSSIISVAVLAAAKVLWDYQLENYYMKIVCRHVLHVQGTWIAKWTSNEWQMTEILTLKQYGWRIYGDSKYSARHEGDGTESHKAYKLEGIIRGENVCMFYWNPERAHIGCGSMTLRICDDGNKLCGHFVLYNVVDAKLADDAIEYCKTTDVAAVA